MDEIRCQAKHTETGGCYSCGGFGFVLEKRKCADCGHEYWDRERRGTTMYDGKELTAYDGMALRYRWNTGLVCASHTSTAREGEK